MVDRDLRNKSNISVTYFKILCLEILTFYNLIDYHQDR